MYVYIQIDVECDDTRRFGNDSRPSITVTDLPVKMETKGYFYFVDNPKTKRARRSDIGIIQNRPSVGSYKLIGLKGDLDDLMEQAYVFVDQRAQSAIQAAQTEIELAREWLSDRGV